MKGLQSSLGLVGLGRANLVLFFSGDTMDIAICFNPIPGDGVNFRGGSSKGTEQLHYYYENICVAFTSIRKIHSTINLVLLTTKAVPKPFDEILQSISVHVKLIRVVFAVEERFAKHYIGSLFILDCIYGQKVDTLYIDPDTICLAEFDSILNGNQNILVYNTFDKPECKAGIALIDAFIQENFQDRKQLQAYYGGEFYYLPANSVPAIKEKIVVLWEMNINAFRTGKLYLTTEEHFLSIILRDFLNLQETKMIQRIWTTRKIRTIPKNLENLAFLHLPAEKDRGLSHLFNLIYSDPQNPNLSCLETESHQSLYRMLQVQVGAIKKIEYLIIQIFFWISKKLKG